MNIFKPAGPRSFHHEWMYVDERAERLADIKCRARRQPDAESAGYDAEAVRQAFREQTVRIRQRRKGFSTMWNLGLLVLLVALLSLVWLYVL